MPTDLIDSVTQFGAAGLMGLLWVWERTLSRRREAQLNETHDRLMRQGDALRVLIKLVRRNTQAIERFERTQEQLVCLLRAVQQENRSASVARQFNPSGQRQSKSQVDTQADSPSTVGVD